MSAPSVTRIDPKDLGIFIAPPDKRGVEHAKQRLKYQLRVLSFLCLLRAKGVIKESAQAEQSKTQYQHGAGDLGEQAAHKIIVSLAIGGTPLIDLCRDDSALYMAMVFLHSDTTVLPRCWNMADQVLEDEGGRTHVVGLANLIISKTKTGATYAEYDECMKTVWGLFSKFWLSKCDLARKYTFEAFIKAREQEQKVQGVISKSTTANQHLEGELEKAKRLQKDALEKVIVLDVYVEEAGKMSGFPLTTGEMDNMWELVFGAPPTKS